MAESPHILILMTDQQRADCLSCAGNTLIQTPNMDRIAAEGVLFSNAYTTSPVCMPARSSFLSGLYSHNHGQWWNYGRLSANTDTYLHHLKRAGYHTCHVGKSHLYPHERGAHLDEEKPFMHALGWMDVLETTGPHATVYTDSIMTDHWQKIGCLDTFRNDYKRRTEARKENAKIATWPSPMPKGETLDDFIGHTAVQYISEYDSKEPVLLFVGFGGPHEPWDPPADWAARYNPSAMKPAKPITEPGHWVPPAAAGHQRLLQNDESPLTTEVAARIRALYYAKISHIDWWCGQVVDAFKKRGFLDNTAIIFWSDHGEMLCDKGRLHKTVFYEESVHVPLIIRPPKMENPGRVSKSIVSLVDIFPTLLDIAGCEPKEECFGRSLMPLFSDLNATINDAVFSEIQTMMHHDGHLKFRTMAFDGRFKMVVDNTGTPLKLYDLAEDPEEAVNLVGKKETEETISHLRDLMLDWYLNTQTSQA